MKIVMLYYVMMIERVIETETKQSKCLVTSKFYRVKSKFSKKVTLSVIIFIIVCQVSCSLVPLPSGPVKKTKKTISVRFTFHEKNWP